MVRDNIWLTLSRPQSTIQIIWGSSAFYIVFYLLFWIYVDAKLFNILQHSCTLILLIFTWSQNKRIKVKSSKWPFLHTNMLIGSIKSLHRKDHITGSQEEVKICEPKSPGELTTHYKETAYSSQVITGGSFKTHAGNKLGLNSPTNHRRGKIAPASATSESLAC